MHINRTHCTIKLSKKLFSMKISISRDIAVQIIDPRSLNPYSSAAQQENLFWSLAALFQDAKCRYQSRSLYSQAKIGCFIFKSAWQMQLCA
jgi:hypothetical protein